MFVYVKRINKEPEVRVELGVSFQPEEDTIASALIDGNPTKSLLSLVKIFEKESCVCGVNDFLVEDIAEANEIFWGAIKNDKSFLVTKYSLYRDKIRKLGEAKATRETEISEIEGKIAANCLILPVCPGPRELAEETLIISVQYGRLSDIYRELEVIVDKKARTERKFVVAAKKMNN